MAMGKDLAAAVHDAQTRIHPALYALILGLLSGLSLPIGAWAGILLSPVSDKVCGMMMAFGAGALLFAVTIELYGAALREVHMGSKGLFELFATIFGALLGAAVYLIINRWLEDYLKVDKVEAYKEQYVDEPGPLTSRSRFSDVDTEPMLTSRGSASNRSRMSDEDLEMPSDPEDTSPFPKALQEQNRSSPKRTLDSSPSPKHEQATSLEGSPTVAFSPRTQASVALMKGEALHHIRGREKALRALTIGSPRQRPEGLTFGKPRKSLAEIVAVAEAKSVATALFLGLLVDGVPEGILIGILAAEGHLTPVLVVSLFVANFPEAFSAASLFVQAEMAWGTIMLMWTSLVVLVGGLAGLSCWLLLLCFPGFSHGGLANEGLPTSVLLGLALIEGITGGAMIACIAAVMLPEAFDRAGKDKTGAFYCHSGFLCTAGFLLAVSMKALLG